MAIIIQSENSSIPSQRLRLSPKRVAVRDLIDFLRTDGAQKIFQKWGWK
jgi:accessory colonization factor AcfC